MSVSERIFKIGTRTSELARIQTGLFVEALRAHAPGVKYEVVGVTTGGDRNRTASIPDLGQGAFVKELEVALVTNEIDLAVHSLKDLPTELPPGLCLAAVLTREDPRDALVSRGNLTLAQLPWGARVGTGSPRRAAQVLAQRPDLRIVLLRGNVDTRIRKVLEENEADAAVLAAAGLLRMGLGHVVSEYFEPDIVLPAVGQGFLGIECREDDQEARALAALTEDAAARRASEAERAFLAAVGGFCKTPLAAYARLDGQGALTLDVLVASLDGRQVVRERATAEDKETPLGLGERLKEAVYARGADRIIAREEARAGAMTALGREE
jgi:hydroxymethylbilane synthase